MTDEWTQPARRELLRLRGGEPGWGYRAGATPGVEPTALAGLGLLVSEPDAPPADGRRATRDAADWLATLQRPDGSLGLSATEPTPGWTTPYALLLWKALATREPECRRAARWLLGIKGRATPRSDDPERIVGHDTTLVGWPWVADTHSWVEPTALAILALGRAGLGEHPRVVEGLRLIRDRAVDTGGWNYGNKATFGRGLRPQPAPTGLALLTLAQTPGEPRAPLVDRAIRYLTATLPGVRAVWSLGWGLLGLRAWSVEPEEADRWLAEAYRNALGRPDAAPRLAHLLLAAGERTLSLFRREASAAEPSRYL